MTQITDGKAFRDKKLPKHYISRCRISRQNQAVEPSLRPFVELALARPLTLRQPLLQAWTSAVDSQRTIPLCSLLCGHIPCHFVSPFFARRRTLRYEEPRTYGVRTAVCTTSMNAKRRQATTQQQAGVAPGRNFYYILQQPAGAATRTAAAES